MWPKASIVVAVMVGAGVLVLPTTAGAAAIGHGSEVVPASAGVPPTVSSVVDLGPITQNRAVTSRDGLFSGDISGKSVWTFGDTFLKVPNGQGSTSDDNSMAWTTNLDGSAGLDLNHDYIGGSSVDVPEQYLPFTQAELTFNEEHAGSGTSCQVQPCGEEYALWNGPVVPDPTHNRALLFYYELLRTVGQSTWTAVGVGIATWTAGSAPVRPIESPGSANPTLLFDGTDPDFADGATVVGSMLYVYGCTAGYLVQNCDVARVPVAQATVQSAWRYFAGNGVWSPDLSQAVTDFQGGAAGTSVTWLPYLDEYQAIYMPPFANEIVQRVAPEPWGPWSAASNVAATATPASGDTDYAGMAHAEFAQDDGQVQYVAYYQPLGGLNAEDHWVQITFGS
jgi:hypothetical protein